MPFPIQLWLVHPQDAMCDAFRQRFKDLPNVRVIQGRFEELEPHDCFVTAANSFGIMNAGIDAAVIRFHGLDLMTLNQSESEAVAGQRITDEASLDAVGRRLIAETRCAAVFVTRGGRGIDVFGRDGARHHVSGITQEVYDVAGAGDSVIATAALALSSGASHAEAATLANYAGNAKVRKLGVVPVSRDDIRDIWRLAEGEA